MTDAQILDLVREIDKMARSVGARFVVEPWRLENFRRAQRDRANITYPQKEPG